MLLRVYAKMDSANKIALPCGIRKNMGIKPCDKLELTIVGMNKVRKLLVTKSRPFYHKEMLNKKERDKVKRSKFRK